jgi:DNA-binding LacI/PurR family transcriptional regulator
LVAEMLLARIADPEAGEVEQMLEAELVEGMSTGPAPRR